MLGRVERGNGWSPKYNTMGVGRNLKDFFHEMLLFCVWKKTNSYHIPVVPAKTLSNLSPLMRPMYQLSELVGEDRGIEWSLPTIYGNGNARIKSKRSLLDQVLLGRGKRWSIFQNIFTNEGETYSRQKVSFGELYILLQQFLNWIVYVFLLWSDTKPVWWVGVLL